MNASTGRLYFFATFLDVETVALHEAGHGLSQAHFGSVFLKNDGTLKAAPRAITNALYAGVLRTLEGTDNGGHCSNWANFSHPCKKKPAAMSCAHFLIASTSQWCNGANFLYCA